MVPQISNNSVSQLQLVSYPSKTYKMSSSQIVGKVDNLEAIKQSIEHILSIERYAYPIYDDNYGVELEKYIGKSKSYLEATIEDTLKEALTQDDRISDIKVTGTESTRVKTNLAIISQPNNKISTEDLENTVTTEAANEITTEDSTKTNLNNSSILEIPVVIVYFTVYCEQGIIETEVNVNV